MSRKARIAKLILVNVAVTLILLIVIEGLLSFLLVGYQSLTRRPLPERAHTEYDEELGWVNLPNVSIQDMYGPGIYLTTNSQRFRNSRDFSSRVPDGKVRIICSGDSFALGYGVDDDHTWCQLLTTLDERLETVNLGQGGYGVDQAYLWYKRNEKQLEHDVQVFAFITDDFMRMGRDTFIGYGRPHLEVQGDGLTQTNRPVPRRSYLAPKLTTAMGKLRDLTTVKLVGKVSSRLGSKDDPALTAEGGERIRGVASRIFADLKRTNQSKQSSLALVYLPTLRDYMGRTTTRAWREFVRSEAAKNDILFIDIVEELRARPPQTVKELFNGHYSVEGNRYVADILYRKLSEASALAETNLNSSGEYADLTKRPQPSPSLQ